MVGHAVGLLGWLGQTPWPAIAQLGEYGSGGGKMGDGCVEEGLEISYQGGQGSKGLGTRGEIVVWFIAAVVSVLRSTM